MTPELKKLSDEAALLPCPFCGGKGHLTHYTGGGGIPAAAHIECWGCGAEGPQVRTDLPANAQTLPPRAIAAWNTRARLAEPEADRIAALEAENATLAAGACHVEGGLIGDEHGHFYCAMERKVAALEAENARLRDLVGRFVRWANMKCPCENEQPNLCTLCGASVENLEPCKAADLTLPRDLLERARAALNRSPNDD